MKVNAPGFYEISGIAWSGNGRVRSVEISADNGKSWATAALGQPILPKAVTRFSMAWRWNGQPTKLLSRAIDETGEMQPMRADWMAQYAPGQPYHYNAVHRWSLDALGDVKNAYA